METDTFTEDDVLAFGSDDADDEEYELPGSLQWHGVLCPARDWRDRDLPVDIAGHVFPHVVATLDRIVRSNDGLVSIFDAQQRERNTYVIVEVADRLMGYKPLAENGGQDFAGCGLSRRTGNCHHGTGKLPAPRRAQGLQGHDRIRHLDLRYRQMGGRGLDQRGHRPTTGD